MNYEQSANQSPSPYEVAPTELRNIARLAIHALDHPLIERAPSPDETLIDADGQTVTVGSLTIDTTQAEQPSLLKTIGVETFAMTHTPACYEQHSDMRYPEMISIATKRYQQTESVYYLKLDIKKFYESVDNDILALCYRHDCKDKELLWLLDEMNYSHKGLLIGSPDSQLLSHVILRSLDRYIKQELRVKHYFRYADDMLILSDSKQDLHRIMWGIGNFLWYNLKLELKENRKIGRVKDGIDMGGYVFFPGYTKVRKSIKKSMIKKRHNPTSMASYMGIMKHCNSHNLINKTITNDNNHMGSLANLGIKIERPFDGRKVKIDKVVGEKIEILDYRILPSIKNDRMRVDMQILYRGEKLFICGSYQYLINVLEKVDRSELPLTDVVILQDRGYYFEGTI